MKKVEVPYKIGFKFKIVWTPKTFEKPISQFYTVFGERLEEAIKSVSHFAYHQGQNYFRTGCSTQIVLDSIVLEERESNE